MNPARGGELRAQAVEQQIVVVAEQQERHAKGRDAKQHEIGVGHRQQAAEKNRFHLVHVELARHRDEQAQAKPERQREKDADQRVVGKLRTPLRVHHRKRRQQREAEHAAIGRVQRLTDEQPHADAGDRRLSERRAEKCHPPRDHEMAEPAQQRREQQRRSRNPRTRNGYSKTIGHGVVGSAVKRSVEGGHAIGDAPHLLGVVRHHQHRHLALQRLQRVVEPARGAFVEAAGGLVENQQLWQRIQRVGQQHAAQLAARQRGQAGGRSNPLSPTRSSSSAIRLRVSLATPRHTGRRCRRQRQKIGDGHRQRAIDLKLLRHVRNAAASRPVGDDRPSNGTSPRIADSSVVLPAPFGPTRACSVPRSTLREKFDSSASRAGRSVRPEISSSGSLNRRSGE